MLKFFCKLSFVIRPSLFGVQHLKLISGLHSSAIVGTRFGNTPKKPYYPRKDLGNMVLEKEYRKVDVEKVAHHISGSDRQVCTDVYEHVANATTDGRLFAVVYISNQQYKVSAEDLISFFAPQTDLDIGEQIILEKVLLVGGPSFTILGRPILGPSEVKVSATVVEKVPRYPTISYHFRAKKQVSYMDVKQTNRVVLRINSVEVVHVRE